MQYNPNKIEAKWQKHWKDNASFQAQEKGSKKFYGLVEFPYPSGDGLHTGHLRSYTAMDIICRYQRMNGYSVLYPMGFDAFGLPTENYAIKNKISPQQATTKNIATFERQLKSNGFSFDWDRSFSTTDEDYYKWTQWIFVQMFKKGLAYKAKENINWCTECKIGLANEEIVGGFCERCGCKVIKKEKEQWMLKITNYADRLIKDLDQIDFLESIKKQQIDWIGRSEGVEVNFKVANEELKVFTTRPDTLFGVTFMVLAPEHKIIDSLKNKIINFLAVSKYINLAKKKSDLDRSETKIKTGIELKGLKVINPVNNEAIPIFVADYVMMSYGTGAIMAVPAHDQRDWEFAKRYKINIKEVIKGGDISNEAYGGDGLAINSGKFNGLDNVKFKEKITKWLVKNNLGQTAVNYKLRDWIFSRQRYWGEPIPMINCSNCGWQAEKEQNLPIILPEVKNYQPSDEGESPLAKLDDWKKATCPKCSGQAERETDVMPNWAGSNWYFIRYCDSKNSEQMVDPKKAKYWLPVDWYNGGMEHATLHLLYSRFVFKFLYDIKALPSKIGSEPYKKRTAQGMILGKGGIKMSKSKGNVVNPDDYISKYGADTVRVYEMFMGPFDQAITWDDQGVVGIFRFLNKIYALTTKINFKAKVNKDLENLLHKTIKKVAEDILKMRFNTAVSQLMILNNSLEKQSEISQEIFEKFILLLAPFAPHLAEELWEQMGHNKSLINEPWPKFNAKLVQDVLLTLGIQVNGKLRDEIELATDTEPNKVLEKDILSRTKIKKYIANKKIVKFIHIKNKIISIVIK